MKNTHVNGVDKIRNFLILKGDSAYVGD